jgi:hypothetical protein
MTLPTTARRELGEAARSGPLASRLLPDARRRAARSSRSSMRGLATTTKRSMSSSRTSIRGCPSPQSRWSRPITALTYVLTSEAPKRFRRSREVGPRCMHGARAGHGPGDRAAGGLERPSYPHSLPRPGAPRPASADVLTISRIVEPLGGVAAHRHFFCDERALTASAG